MYPFNCEKCGHQDWTVLETRHSHIKGKPNSPATRRRRECLGCGDRFTTYEVSGADYDDLLSATSAIAKLRIVLGEIARILTQFEPRIPDSHDSEKPQP